MDSIGANNERRTEVDGLEVLWQLVDHTARIVSVREATGAVLLSCGPDHPDLAAARERFPKLSVLWDAVRHQLWAELTPPQQLSYESQTNKRPAR
ncbi:hypothetical protein [Nocardia gamkensis]|uniref:Uncharacterized protein n=1 Tax=Nocardia gamkensis TaxID=352869 RepID=A0A7X6L5Z8_9NOCA|nr:hypothetical protein [Nocardia gamkensis]NKY28454.1 hypothetical protein [Nocardia gamkensis]NQE69163.1 hypothetical protein [Nocardia gamkensis]